MIVIVDYGVGNLFSLRSSFAAIGADVTVSSDAAVIASAEKIVLPGVGAFGDAVKKLRDSGLDKVVIEQAKAGKKLLGICLGMQLLFEKSYEYGEWDGLGLLHGSVVPMEGKIPAELMIPHIGWNALIKKREHPLLAGLSDGDCVYFVHSYYAEGCEDSLIATAEYGPELTAMVAKDNVAGAQFHPEKSADAGLSILKAFIDW
jgi:glutamine amidotransferase